MNAIRNARKALEATAKPTKKTPAKPDRTRTVDAPAEPDMVPLTYKNLVSAAELEIAVYRYQHLLRGGLAALRFLAASEEITFTQEVRAIIADLAQAFPDEDTTP